LNIGCDVDSGDVGNWSPQHFANPYVIHCCALEFVPPPATCLKSAFQIHEISFISTQDNIVTYYVWL
jgi:hypothetical protein